LRFAEPITFAVERILPGRARRLLSIYESWFERLRTRSGGKSSGTVLILRAVVVDVLLAAAIIFAFRIWQSEIELTLIRRFHLGPQLVTTVASLVLGLALLPVLVLLTATAYKLSRKLTQLVLPKNNSSARAFLQAALVFVIVVSVGLVAAGLLAPVVGAVYAWVTFSFTLLAALAILWQRAGALDHEITSGSELLMQAIAEQSMPEEERHTEQPSVLPQNLREFTLHDGHFALGRSLSDLKLRSMTGASVLAVRAAQGSAQSPTGTEILSVGETLFIAGCNVDQDAAVELLSTGQLNRNASTP
jgi:hypothetical protein